VIYLVIRLPSCKGVIKSVFSVQCSLQIGVSISRTLEYKFVTYQLCKKKTDLMTLDNIHHVLLILVAVQLNAVRPSVTFELRFWLRT